MERELNFDKDKWICPKCGGNASKYFCGNGGFKIYAGFVLRFLALLIDSAILSFIFVFVKAFSNKTIGSQLESGVFLLCLGLIYEVYLVGLFGQTPGKMYTKIIVVRLDGSNIKSSNAWLRFSVNILCTVLAQIGLFYIGIKTSMDQTINSIDPFMVELPWLFKISFAFLSLVIIGYDWSELLFC